MAASFHSKQVPAEFSPALEVAVPALTRRSFVQCLASKAWLALGRFVAEALEEHGKLHEKNPYGWWL